MGKRGGGRWEAERKGIEEGEGEERKRKEFCEEHIPKAARGSLGARPRRVACLSLGTLYPCFMCKA